MVSRHSVDTEAVHALKEQLRLFAFDTSEYIDQDVVWTVRRELEKREQLQALLDGELNFHGEDSSYASHDLHAFAAKFPPQLPRAFIRGLTALGDVVLDPMMGSGTTVVEALLEGRRGIGLDIDPLALRLSKAKTTLLDLEILRQSGLGILKRANELLADEAYMDRSLLVQFDASTKNFVDYWFQPQTQRELLALAIPIQEVADPSIRRFLELTFSAIIVTKSGGVSRARDLAHSRPHLDATKVPRNALDQFSLRLRKNLSSMAQLRTNGASVMPLASDARCMPLADESIDLIVTSPPYANAIDYMRAHKFSLVWLGESVADLSRLRAEYIGSERIGQARYGALPDKTESTIDQLAEKDSVKAAVLRKYYVEMQSVIVEMHRVLRPNSAAIIVVGTSVMRGVDVQTQYCLTDIAAAIGFDVVGVAQRVLDRNKRMMPARFGRKGDSMIEQRMHEEYVVGLLRPI